MMTKSHGMQLKMIRPVVSIEDYVPQNHLLRNIAAAVDFSFIYDEVKDLYSADNGRPSVDPVQLIKYLLIGFLYNINSERQIEIEIQGSAPYRWFMGLNMDDKVPDHSTISQNRRRRFNGIDLYRRIFERILAQCIENRLVEGKLILTDSTHVRANASRSSEVKIRAEKETAWYEERLAKCEATEREALENAHRLSPKKTIANKSSKPEMVERRVSTTDPEAGFLSRPSKPHGMHYLNHQSVDAKNGIIVDVAVTPGNVTDATPYLNRIRYMQEFGLPIEAVGVDSAYDISLVHHELLKNNIEIYTPKNDEMPVYKTEFKREDFQYDEEKEVFICPAGNKLALKRLNRNDCTISHEYKAKINDCRSCLLREKCLAPSQKCRRLQVNIFEAAVRRNHEKDGTLEHRRVLALRQIWCEGTFAAQKARHNLRRLYRRGLKAAEEHCLLSAIAVNLKRMVKHMKEIPSSVYSGMVDSVKRVTLFSLYAISSVNSRLCQQLRFVPKLRPFGLVFE